MSSSSLHFLRPASIRTVGSIDVKAQAYLQFYKTVRSYSKIQDARPGGLAGIKRVEDSMRGIIPSKTIIMMPRADTQAVKQCKPESASKQSEYNGLTSQRQDVKERVKELKAADALHYPRVERADLVTTCEKFRSTYDGLKAGESHDDVVTLRGRIYSSRTAGSKLLFIDLVQDGFKVQGMFDHSMLASGAMTADTFKAARRLLKRGDIISMTGNPMRTPRGELSIKAKSLPSLLTPALASLPTNLDSPSTLIKARHADLLVHPKTSDTLKLRSHIIQGIRHYLISEQFLEVQTPILARSAGGAVARPFTTLSTEFPEKPLSLRIAPELWLKRLVIGGMDRVFEIGPVFRNEGVDGTHNPEFYTCEFYKAFASLEDLIEMTEHMMQSLTHIVNELAVTRLKTIKPVGEAGEFDAPFLRLAFIPTLEKALDRGLPDLSSPGAFDELIEVFRIKNLTLPTTPTLPRLLDRLCGEFIEPLTMSTPTFITYHPAVLAPLSKSFVCPETGQQISARAELFIGGKEIANMYEEENSPFEQKRKFSEQRLYIDGAEGEVTGEIDEGYVEAMEWGLPPTGGWGMGLERLVMLLAGRERIGDVLSFGTVRNVVGLGKAEK